MYSVSVVVIDNDDHDGLSGAIVDRAADFRFPLRYVHAPARNISVARNAALDAAEGRWLLFIDDDEVAHRDWLRTIVAHREGADAVIGRSVATYADHLPGWAARCDFHSNAIESNPVNAYTSNALLDMDFVRRQGLRFRLELGRTGGEDSVFFRQMHLAGARICYCPDAVVFEPVPPVRATMTWVFRRKYRAGQTHGLLCREFDRSAYARLFVTAGAKAVASFVMSLAVLPGTDRSRRWLARGVFHIGALRYRIAPRIMEEYG